MEDYINRSQCTCGRVRSSTGSIDKKIGSIIRHEKNYFRVTWCHKNSMHFFTDGPTATEGAISEETAQEVFDDLKNNDVFLWEYIEDGCFARTHKACSLLHGKGIYCEKIRADNPEWTWFGSFGLAIPKKDAPEKFIFISFHMAVVIRVITSFGIEERILDPALFDTPVTHQQWAGKLLNRHSIITDCTIKQELQQKEYTRIAWDVFETILFWKRKDTDLKKTHRLLEMLRAASISSEIAGE